MLVNFSVKFKRQALGGASVQHITVSKHKVAAANFQNPAIYTFRCLQGFALKGVLKFVLKGHVLSFILKCFVRVAVGFLKLPYELCP